MRYNNAVAPTINDNFTRVTITLVISVEDVSLLLVLRGRRLHEGASNNGKGGVGGFIVAGVALRVNFAHQRVTYLTFKVI